MMLKFWSIPQFGQLALAWTFLAVLAAGSYGVATYRQITDRAKAEARTILEMDWTYRDWNSTHGGVYVPVTDKTQPNPYLEHVPERDIVTPSGRKLTLMNPAYMTRQVHELISLTKKRRGHITSLKPMRPENKADDWETEALREIEKTRQEVSGFSEIGGVRYVRVMKPLVTTESCMKCHQSQGYSVGDIRGGLSASVPWSDYGDMFLDSIYAMAPGSLLIWLVGLLGARYALKRVSEDEKALFRAAKVASLGTLTSGIAHEINNPLVIASGNLSMLADKLRRDPAVAEDGEHVKRIQKIEAAHSRIGQVVSGIRSIADSESQDLGPVDIHDIIRDIRLLSDTLIGLPSEAIGVTFGAKSPLALAHDADLRKVFLHLLSNAHDAVEAKGDKGIVEIRTEDRDSMICVHITDNGNGIPAAALERAFDPFFTTKEPGKGLGLGLFVAKNLVENMAGEIELHSEEGHGTTVTLCFERVQNA